MLKLKSPLQKCETCQSRGKGIFCELGHLDLEEIDQYKITNIYKKGQTLFFQGNPPYGLFCISYGKVKISKIGPNGKESILRIAQNGDILGHRSLFTDQYYQATATALEESVICFLDKKFILKTVKERPSVSFQVICKLSYDMGAAEQKVASLFQKNVSERLAEFLLLLKENYGVKESGKIKLDIKLTREEMASIIGTANETLIRFLSDFKKMGYIDQKGKTLFIIDEEGLIEEANVNY